MYSTNYTDILGEICIIIKINIELKSSLNFNNLICMYA